MAVSKVVNSSLHTPFTEAAGFLFTFLKIGPPEHGLSVDPGQEDVRG